MGLKDAMQKIGLKSTKSENERDQKVSTEKTKIEKHQERRNFCEVCELTQPDVERFKHNNPRIDAEWICSNCADKNEILDDFRMTNQSDSVKNSRYRRYYGHTKDFSATTDTTEENKVKADTRKKPNYKHDRNKKRTPGNEQGESRHASGGGGGANRNRNNRNSRPGNRSNNRNDNRRPNNRNDNRRPNNRNSNENRGNVSNHENRKGGAKYIIDDDGEKNFNC